MSTPNPLEPVKGAGTTLWVYNGQGDAYADPLPERKHGNTGDLGG